MADTGKKLSVLRRIRASLRQMFPSVAVFFKAQGLVYSSRSMLRKLGYVESAKAKRPVRRDGSPLPWMNYHIIQFLEDRLTDDLSLFEYGSGNSTCFYASYVKDVISLEMDEEWYSIVKETMPENVSLILFDESRDGRYTECAAKQGKKFDVIVVDAAERNECAMKAPDALSHKGIIILDDSFREFHAECIDYLLNHGFRKLDFEGIKPNSIRAYRSTIFYRADNCVGL